MSANGTRIMLKSLHCIALRTVRYNDRHNIVTAYSREQGRVSLLVAAGRSREASRQRALTMPMSLFECVADVKSGRDIYSMREVRQSVPLHDLYSHPVKITVAMFLAEVLGVILRESQEDNMLFGYMAHAIGVLDAADDMSTANFPVAFMYGLGRFTGIEPDMSTYAPGRVFDMVDGVFRVSLPLHRDFLEGDDAAAVYVLSRMNWDNIRRFRFNRVQRRRILEAVMRYYTLHYASLSSINSIAVLKELFD